ncbi:hypothetical protein FRC16_006206 [Serendipita sp. 398]|nr:hypothetical protein FRC16_006206 [Serendipita sp. 398]KAG8817466.1 hypothetical protein FRC18_000496 [Serendipita sp. 400]
MMYPRMSISGRLSQDGWPPSTGVAFHGGHSRRGSLTHPVIPNGLQRSHSLAFVEEDGAMRMERLREEDEDEDADERTRLTRQSVEREIRTSRFSPDSAPRIEGKA